MGITYIIGVYEGGIGHTFEQLTMPEVIINTKAIFAGQFFYLFSVGTAKISIVLFYQRIFFITTNFIRATNVMLVIIGLWLTAFFLTTLFQSWPISQNWTGVGRNLMNYPDMYLALGATDLAIDVVILCMPMPVIKSLKLEAKKKITVACILGLGFLSVIASGVRINYVNQIEAGTIQSFSIALARYMIWSEVEACWSIVCACLPTLGPLFRNGRAPESIINSVRCAFSKRSSESLNGSKSKKSSDSRSSHFQPQYPSSINTEITGGHSEARLPKDITVQTTVSSSEEMRESYHEV